MVFALASMGLDAAPGAIETLAAHGANLDAFDPRAPEHYQTPLRVAVDAGRAGNVRALVEWGATVDGIDGKGEPLIDAVRKPDPAVVQVLLEHWADPDAARGEATMAAASVRSSCAS
jgi:ankyrin repeat protein